MTASTGQQLQTFDENEAKKDNFVPVTRRIKGIDEGMAIHKKTVDDNDKRDQRRGKVMNHHNGHPPRTKADLKKAGELWRSNIPFREHEAKIEEMTSIYADLDDRVPTIAKIKTTFNDDAGLNLDLGRRTSECYHNLLTEHWTGYFDEKESGIQEMNNFGYFAIFWPDETSFKFIHLKSNQVLLPSGSRSNPDKWDYVGVRMGYTVNDLWRRINTAENASSARKLGWDPDVMKMAIMKASTIRPDKDEWQLGDWVNFEQKIINNDIHFDSISSKPIRCAHQLTREMDGKIRRTIIFEDMKLDNWIYDKKTEFDSFEHFLQVTYFGVKTFFHSHRGTGEKIYNHTLMIDVLGNEGVDSTRLDQTVFFKGRPSSRDRKMKFGKFMMLDDMTIERNVTGESAGSAVAMSRFINQKMNNNVALHDNTGDRESVQPISAQEATLNSLRKNGIQRTHINRFYRGQDKMHKEIFRRLTVSDTRYRSNIDGADARRKFLDECEEAGIPREALAPKFNKVRSARSIGRGSLAAEDVATQEIVGYALNGVMEDQGKVQKALHNRIATVADFDIAEEFFPVTQPQIDDATENTLITMMINDLREGTFVAVEPRQRHAKHSTAIINMLGQEIEGRGQQDPVGLFRIMMPSMTKLADHLDFMRSNPSFSQQLAQIEPQFNQLLEIFNQVQKAAEQIQEAELQQMQLEREAIQNAMSGQPDPETLDVILKNRDRELDTRLHNEVRMTKVNNTHVERLRKIGLDARADRVESASEQRGQEDNAVSPTPRITTRPAVPEGP